MLKYAVAGDRRSQPQPQLRAVIQLHELWNLFDIHNQFGGAEPLSQLHDQVSPTRQHPRRSGSAWSSAVASASDVGAS